MASKNTKTLLLPWSQSPCPYSGSTPGHSPTPSQGDSRQGLCQYVTAWKSLLKVDLKWSFKLDVGMEANGYGLSTGDTVT